MQISDADLVLAVLGGNRAAYAALYDRHAPMVRAICHDHTRSLAHAQDVSQEVFMKAYCKLGLLRDPDRFAAWLVGIARNECRDWHRRRSRDRHEFVERVPDVVDVTSSSHEKGSAEMLETMRLLPEKERLALHAFYLQGESADNIQALLGMSTSGVYRLIERARKRLAELLDRAQEEAL